MLLIEKYLRLSSFYHIWNNFIAFKLVIWTVLIATDCMPNIGLYSPFMLLPIMTAQTILYVCSLVYSNSRMFNRVYLANCLILASAVFDSMTDSFIFFYDRSLLGPEPLSYMWLKNVAILVFTPAWIYVLGALKQYVRDV